jgi:hypothetical protein
MGIWNLNMLNKNIINPHALVLSILITINIYFGPLSIINPLSYWGNVNPYQGLQSPSFGFFPTETLMVFSSIVVWGISYLLIRILQDTLVVNQKAGKIIYFTSLLALFLTILFKFVPIRIPCTTSWILSAKEPIEERIVEVFFQKECPDIGSTTIEL